MTPRHAALLACLWPLLAWAQPVLGTPPRHAPPTLAEVPNAQAITQRIWAPGIDDGYVPQGVAWAGGRLYLSAYRSTDPAVGQGPCRVFQIDPAHGATLGWLDMPPGCGHAGGLVALDERTLVLGDTRRLYRIDLIAAFGPRPDAARAITATVGLRGALKASSMAFDGQRLLLATHAAQPAQALAHWLPLAVLDSHSGSDIDESAATDRIALAKKDQEFARAVLDGTDPGDYGTYALRWKRGRTTLDQKAARAELEAHDLPVPTTVTRPSIDVQRITP